VPKNTSSFKRSPIIQYISKLQRRWFGKRRISFLAPPKYARQQNREVKGHKSLRTLVDIDAFCVSGFTRDRGKGGLECKQSHLAESAGILSGSSRVARLQTLQNLSVRREYAQQSQIVEMQKIVILLVEDEAIIRMGTVPWLEDAGYTVLEASSADEAITILDSRLDINAVFTDIKMPGSLCGLKLARAIRKRWPPIQLIVASGLRAPTEAEFPGVGRFIPKPYQPRDVLKALHELFELNPTPYRYSANIIQNYGRVA
jgi:CheY-like chemotaxis protein